ncbi:Glycosyltransferase involved in cell wall bisynthesis [Pseudobutyrivibrio sp. UC1225]|uniref:glycosyltransferase family 2 protein n=1 Tax=Pseudobutyrivibrio sp. UC1225 TaxID=1798185 RepID=UPI0008EC1F07|nr:glycosyltransferase family 2 protein [Pseudobutyrivibrio sp. UC1225]SFN78969.1 Glycosyltransferase involved in cell wall bisynthesis [Pseudobutyrivibrio sp. UC1225]
MKTDIKVSVIVPAYNVEQYLSECLDSIERQTLKEIEVIIVNDGSKDNSEVIAKKYCNRNENYKLINRDNGGLSAARNTGMSEARGEYIYFLDSDDYLADDALEKLYKKAKEENLDQVRFVAYTFEDGTNDYKWTGIDEGGYKYSGNYPNYLSGINFYKQAIDNNDYYPSCCLIFTRRKVIEENNLRFYEGILHEDNLFNFELTCLCDRVSILHEPLYYRRYRTDSIVKGTNWIEKNRSMCISAEETDIFLKKHPYITAVVGEQQIKLFTLMMLNNWEHMNKKEQNSHESQILFDRIKPLVVKYMNGGGPIKVFYISKPLYRLYIGVVKIVGRMRHLLK